MGEIKPIAWFISFIIWLYIDITVLRNLKKGKYKTKSEKFIETAKAKAKGNYTIGSRIKTEYYRRRRDNDGVYHESYWKAIYEYIIKGKKYKKKLYYYTNPPLEVTIYYKANNPRKSFAGGEDKHGLIYTILVMVFPFSIILGISLLAMLITILIGMF